MIPVTAYAGLTVGVLGLGRSGLTAARALRAGGAAPLVWDDAEAAREKAAGEGLEVADLTREREAGRLARLVVSPGIAHLYPAPHPAVAQAQAAGVFLVQGMGTVYINNRHESVFSRI